MKSDYFLYMAEAEGFTDVADTRQAYINEAINMYKAGSDSELPLILLSLGIDPATLTDKEYNYILKEVER